jgi:hypothetical protein
MILITTIATVYILGYSAFSRPSLLFSMIDVNFKQRWLETVATAAIQQVVRSSG